MPENYRGLSFSIWLDIFLEYALCLVRRGKQLQAYEICEAAKDAIVFYHNKEDMFLIHLTWCGKQDLSVVPFSADVLELTQAFQPVQS